MLGFIYRQSVVAFSSFAGCTTVSSPPPAAPVQLKESVDATLQLGGGGANVEELVSLPFADHDATHVLTVDFWQQSRDYLFRHSVSERVSAELRRFEVEESPHFPLRVFWGSLEAALPCFIESHEEAAYSADASGADLVVWSQAYCKGQKG